jgi:hypothetical protein
MLVDCPAMRLRQQEYEDDGYGPDDHPGLSALRP